MAGKPKPQIRQMRNGNYIVGPSPSSGKLVNVGPNRDRAHEVHDAQLRIWYKRGGGVPVEEQHRMRIGKQTRKMPREMRGVMGDYQ